MSETTTKPVRSRRILQAGVGVLLIGFALWAAWFFTGDSFNNYVRNRVISHLEQMTGGTVEVRQVKWNVSKLEFELSDVTIHGLEKADELPPYAHADRLYIRAKVVSVFQQEVDFRHVTLERPVIHIIVYPDGSTNQPRPKARRGTERVVQELFDLGIERAEVRDGVLIWNQRRIPLDFAANDVSAEMTYKMAENRYDGRLRVGKIDTTIDGYRPFGSHADVEFSILSSHLQIKSLRWNSGRSFMQADGVVSEFENPKVTLAYKGSLDLAETAAILRIREIRTGMMEVQGKGEYSLATFSAAGELAVRDFAYRESSVSISNGSATSDFAVDRQRISFSKIVGRALGGLFEGDASISNWARKGVQVGRINLRLNGTSVSQVAEAVSTSKVPLKRLNAVGSVAGSVTAEWRGALSNLRTSFDLTMFAPSDAAPDQVPVQGTFRGNYRNGADALEITELDVRTRSAELRGSGTLGSAAGNVKFAVKASSIEEFRPMIEAIRGPEPLLVDVGGSLAFTGMASGRFTQPTIQGHLQLRDFVTLLPQAGVTFGSAGPGTASASSDMQKVHWDMLGGDVLYSPTQMSIARGVLRRGAAQINIDASSALKKGTFDDSLPFAGRVIIRNADAAELQSILGYGYPVTGMLNANLQFGGSRKDPRGNGHFALSDAVIYGQPVRSASADFALLHREVQLRNIAVVSDSGQLRGFGAYNYSTEAFKFDVRGTNFNLSGFKQLQTKRMQLEGIANFDAQGSGTLGEPVVNAKLRITNVFLNGERIGDLTADAVTHGADLKLSALSSYQNAALKLEGQVRLRGDMPAQLDMNFGDIDLNPLLKSYLVRRMTGHTTLAGTMHLSGPLKRPRELNGELNIDRFLANVESIAIHNDGPIRAVMANQVVRIERFRLVGEETHFIEASGNAQFGGSQRLNLRVAGRLNMKLLHTFSPEVSAYGTSDFGLDVLGTLRRPQLNGRVQIANAGISYTDLPNGLSGINGSLIFTQDRLQVESLTAKTGGGDLVLGGFITYDRAITFNLTARGQDIRLRYPPGISSTADANLTLAGTLKNSLLSGEITVTKFGVNPRFDFGLYLARSKQTPQVPAPDSPLSGLKFDVHVISTPELEVQTSLAKVSGDVDLRLRGTAARPTVLGRVNIVEGNVSFNGTQYHLERGDVTFTNPVRIEPILDLEATARVRDYDISLGLHGSTDRVVPTFRSDPPLPQGDIIALLALGRTREESVVQSMNSQQSTTMLTESASNALLGQALNATVSSRVQKLFGVSRIKIDPQVGGPENNPNARLTIEQAVSNKITLTYITNLSQSAQQIIQVEYNINRSVSVLAVRDQNGVVGFDVRVRQRKK